MSDQWRVKNGEGSVWEAPMPCKNERGWHCDSAFGATKRHAVAQWAIGEFIDWTEIAAPGELFASVRVDAEIRACAEVCLNDAASYRAAAEQHELREECDRAHLAHAFREHASKLGHEIWKRRKAVPQ